LQQECSTLLWWWIKHYLQPPLVIPVSVRLVVSLFILFEEVDGVLAYFKIGCGYLN
jgi:hypothetical protein